MTASKVGTSTKKAYVVQDFEGGLATDLKVGVKNSFGYAQSINFRDSPSQLTLLQQPVREDNGVIQDLVQNEVMVSSGETYSMGNTGYVYTRNTSGVWSHFGNLRNGYYGMDYRQDLDAVYLCSDKTVSLINPISTAPVLNVDYYNISQSTYNNTTNTGFNVNADQTGSSTAISILTTFNETMDQQRFFQTDIEPLTKVSLNIDVKGTGNWTVTLHDGLNNVLATSTVTNANLTSGQFNDFPFGSQIRVSVAPAARTYHIHVTSTVGDGSVFGTIAGNLSSCDLEIWADRLIIQSNGIHAMTNFQEYECIGNANYLSVWQPLGDPNPPNTEWLRHKLQFPPYYQVCGLAVFNEYLAIACERVVINSDTQNDGIIFFWDGLSTTYNYFMVVPEGSPQAIYQHKNVLYYYAGTNWYAMTSVTSMPVKIRKMPNASSDYTSATTQTRINPYAITNRRSTVMMAWPSSTTNTTIPYGVYSWGSTDKNFADSFGYSYLLSTGSTNYSVANGLQIGMVRAFGSLMHVSWQDNLNGKFGVDAVKSTSTPALFSRWDSLIFDNGYVSKQKEADFMEAYWLPLPSGVTIVLKYNINRTGWIHSNTNSAVEIAIGGYTSTNTWQDGDGYAKFSIGESSEQGRFNEVQIGLNIYCDSTVTQSPTLLGASLVFDTLNQEDLQ